MTRKAVYEILTKDSAFAALMPVVYERGSVPDSPVAPFAILAMTGSPRQGRSFSRLPRAELWCYQDRGDYSVIDAALQRADELLSAATHYVSDDGSSRLAEATPQGWSGDLYDDVYRANTRNAGYLLVGSGG